MFGIEMEWFLYKGESNNIWCIFEQIILYIKFFYKLGISLLLNLEEMKMADVIWKFFILV